MEAGSGVTGARLSVRAKHSIIIGLLLAALLFLFAVRAILWPFLWAILVAYLLTPVVNYLSVRGGLPRLWAVTMLYALVGLTLLAGSQYLYPQVMREGTI